MPLRSIIDEFAERASAAPTDENLKRAVELTIRDVATTIGKCKNLGRTHQLALLAALTDALDESVASMKQYHLSRTRLLFESSYKVVVRDPNLRALIVEILTDHDQQAQDPQWRDSRRARGWLHACAIWALVWNCGVFKIGTGVLRLVARVWSRRA